MDRLYGITTRQPKGSKFFPKYRGLGVGVGFMTKSNYGHGVSWRFATFRTISRTPGTSYAHTEYQTEFPTSFYGLLWVGWQCYGNSLHYRSQNLCNLSGLAALHLSRSSLWKMYPSGSSWSREVVSPYGGVRAWAWEVCAVLRRVEWRYIENQLWRWYGKPSHEISSVRTMTGMPNAVCECGEWCPWVKTFSMLRILNQLNKMLWI